MRILKIYDGDYPWDVRVEKVAETLIAAGHSVRLLCRNRRRQPMRRLQKNTPLEAVLPGPASLDVPAPQG